MISYFFKFSGFTGGTVNLISSDFAALGVIVALFLLTILGGINALLLAALLFSLGSAIFFPSNRWLAAISAVLGVLLALNAGLGLLDLNLKRAESTKTIATALDPDGLQGQVTRSDSGAAVDGARVLIRGTNFMAESGADGSYSITGVPEGRFGLTCSAPNLQAYPPGR